VSAQRLQPVSTVDALAAALRRELLDGARPGGARLPERELCEDYGVARHTLRAALRARRAARAG
jgi:DNA-binding GntR family transcriptional regulator